MDAFRRIYASEAGRYHAMISHEDCQHALRAAFSRLTDLSGKVVVDVGSGTGRIPLLVHEQAKLVVALDQSEAMLRESANVRRNAGAAWELVKANATQLPLRSGVADVTVAAWALGHTCGWFPEAWPTLIDAALGEMIRVTAKGGLLVVIETLGTGTKSVAPPESLQPYYERLQSRWGFEQEVLATDYDFPSVEAAVSGTEFFFGTALAEQIRQSGSPRVPEWTALFTRRN